MPQHRSVVSIYIAAIRPTAYSGAPPPYKGRSSQASECYKTHPASVESRPRGCVAGVRCSHRSRGLMAAVPSYSVYPAQRRQQK